MFAAQDWLYSPGAAAHPCPQPQKAASTAATANLSAHCSWQSLQATMNITAASTKAHTDPQLYYP